MLVGYLLINNTIDNVVKPKFVGDAVGLSITMAFLSLVVWGFVLGPLGALLAIPATLLARAVLSDADPRRAWVGIMSATARRPGTRLGEMATRGLDPRGPGRRAPRPGPRRSGEGPRVRGAALQPEGLLEHDGAGVPSAGQPTWP